MRVFLLLLPILSLFACGTGYHWRSEEFQEMYSTETRAKEKGNLDRQKIYYSLDRGEVEFLGVLEKNQIRLEGQRNPRMHYIIFDRHHEKVGFISAEGEFSRFDAEGRLQPMGEFPILMKGLKVFFGFPLASREHEYQIFLQPIDPYGNF